MLVDLANCDLALLLWFVHFSSVDLVLVLSSVLLSRKCRSSIAIRSVRSWFTHRRPLAHAGLQHTLTIQCRAEINRLKQKVSSVPACLI